MAAPPPDDDGPENGTGAAAAFAPLRFDPAAFRHHVDDFDMTDKEKDAWLTAAWVIFSSFADVGYKRHPVQHALDVSKARTTLAADSDPMVACRDAFNEQSNKQAQRSNRRKGRRKDS